MPEANWDNDLAAEDGIRTRDPQLGKLMLYQLSYFRIENVLTMLSNPFYLTSEPEKRARKSRLLSKRHQDIGNATLARFSFWPGALVDCSQS